MSATTTVQLVEDCVTPVAPSSTNLIFSEYVTNGDGACAGPDCEAGEAIEITNLSHCPVSLDGYHFAYCNPSSCGTFRWMDFGPTDIVPPRGVYVAIRNQTSSMCSYPFFGPDDPGLYGLRISTLAMQGSGLTSGWFANGVLTWTSGVEAGRKDRVLGHSKAGGAVSLTLWRETPTPPVSGATFDIVAGCDKSFATCAAKFSNTASFRGFPHLPGNDVAYGYVRDGAIFDGGPLVP